MQTTMYMLTETSPYMMSFVIVTEQNNCIVVDGGRPEDMPLLKEYVGGRHISAWFLTHAHCDHITGIMSEMEKNGLADFDLEKLYYHFPDHDEWMKHADEAPNPDYFRREMNEQIPRFNRLVPCLGDRVHIAQQGEHYEFDEVKIDVLYTTHEGLYANPMNDSSMVFKVTTPRKTVLFLGDLGPDGGDILFDESRHLLKSDIVQMAHHGHECVQMHVYAEILPEAYCDELALLQSDVDPMSFDQVKDALADIYGERFDGMFLSIDPQPLGSASLAQVHRAVLSNGDSVAVKVQRPGVRETMAQDIDIMRSLAKRAKKILKDNQMLDLEQVVEELWNTFVEETDFTREAENLEEFALLNQNVVYIDCPRPYLEYCNPRSLVMQYIDGISIRDTERLEEEGYDLEEIGEKMLDNYATQILDHGFFHADPHPGNIFIKGGQVI
jgi:hypothetical protein